MKEKNYTILMADIINSGESNQNRLINSFKKIIEGINLENKKLLISPLTITLGDEFQGISTNTIDAIALIFKIEEKIIQQQTGFKLRYVLYEGKIDTPINKNIAYGMLGEGLTNARLALTAIKSGNNRFYCELKNGLMSLALNNALFIYQNIIDAWKISRDYELIVRFIALQDYKLVADSLNKTRSQIWKREKTLRIEEYFSIKRVIMYIAESR